MRIAVFTKSTTFNKGHGGLETQNKLLCEGLVKRGHAVTVFTPLLQGNLANTTLNGVEYLFVPCSYRYLFSGLNKHSWFNQSYEIFTKKHAESPYDLILGQSSAAIGIIDRKEQIGVPIISIAHGTTLGELKTQLANIQSVKDFFKAIKNGQYVLRQFFGRQRDFILKSNHIIAVSNAVKNNLIEETFCPDENITVINNGIDPTPFTKAKEGRSLTGNSFLFVGKLTKDKGIDFLVDTFCLDSFKNLKLYIAGDGPLEETIKEKITNLHLEERIIFLGKIPYDQIVNNYLNDQMIIFAFPTRREEGLPMVLVEAMFAGLPVVAFNKGGVSDIIVNDSNGFVLAPGDNKGYVESLLGLATNPELLKKFSQNALKSAYNSLSLDVMIEKYTLVFQKVIENENM